MFEVYWFLGEMAQFVTQCGYDSRVRVWGGSQLFDRHGASLGFPAVAVTRFQSVRSSRVARRYWRVDPNPQYWAAPKAWTPVEQPPTATVTLIREAVECCDGLLDTPGVDEYPLSRRQDVLVRTAKARLMQLFGLWNEGKLP